ncbi:hypothetical protein DXG01_017181 [Tephrocybe rancida]|nr:hypothetical protein DXG01_017181 [Tephrocybe rancida]
MSDITQDEIISTIKHLDGIIGETFNEGYPYQCLRGFYPNHLERCRKKNIPYAPKAALFPPIVTLPVPAEPTAGTIPMPVADMVADSGNPSVPIAMAAPTLDVPGPIPTPVAGSNLIPVAARTPVANPTPAPVAGPARTSAPGKPSAPIPPSSTKVRMAMITPAGHPGHGPSASKKKVPSVIPAEIPKVAGAEKVQQVPADKVKGQAGKQKPNPEEDGWYIDGIHAVPCPNCVSHNQECERHVGKDNKVGACIACFWVKMRCPHSMKGKGKKGEEATSDAPRKVKAKPKRKAPKSPEYMSNNNDNEESPARPAPPQKPTHVIFPTDPIQVVMEEDIAAAWRRAQGARPRAAPLPMIPTKWKPVPSWPPSPTPGPSNDPLLATALEAHVTLPSHTPPPGPRRERRWTAEIWDLTSRVSDFEDSTDIGFKRLKEHISKHCKRCDHTSARVTDLEEGIQKLEHRDLEERSRSMRQPTPVARTSRQGCTFISPSPSVSSAEHSDDDEEQGEIQAGVESDGHKEVQASEEDAEGREVSSKQDTAMGDFSDDTPSPATNLLGGVPIIPGVARATLAPTMGDGDAIPAIQLTNPMPENSQDQLTPLGPPVQRTSPRLHSDGSGCELQPHTPAPPATGVKRKADKDDSGGCVSKPPSKRQHR